MKSFNTLHSLKIDKRCVAHSLVSYHSFQMAFQTCVPWRDHTWHKMILLLLLQGRKQGSSMIKSCRAESKWVPMGTGSLVLSSSRFLWVERRGRISHPVLDLRLSPGGDWLHPEVWLSPTKSELTHCDPTALLSHLRSKPGHTWRGHIVEWESVTCHAQCWTTRFVCFDLGLIWNQHQSTLWYFCVLCQWKPSWATQRGSQLDHNRRLGEKTVMSWPEIPSCAFL
jgi:hypothetical protein